jgi:hypothetical protein
MRRRRLAPPAPCAGDGRLDGPGSPVTWPGNMSPGGGGPPMKTPRPRRSRSETAYLPRSSPARSATARSTRTSATRPHGRDRRGGTGDAPHASTIRRTTRLGMTRSPARSSGRAASAIHLNRRPTRCPARRTRRTRSPRLPAAGRELSLRPAVLRPFPALLPTRARRRHGRGFATLEMDATYERTPVARQPASS